MKNSNDTIGNLTRDLPACSAVLQPTAPPCSPFVINADGKDRTLSWPYAAMKIHSGLEV